MNKQSDVKMVLLLMNFAFFEAEILKLLNNNVFIFFSFRDKILLLGINHSPKQAGMS